MKLSVILLICWGLLFNEAYAAQADLLEGFEQFGDVISQTVYSAKDLFDNYADGSPDQRRAAKTEPASSDNDVGLSIIDDIEGLLSSAWQSLMEVADECARSLKNLMENLGGSAKKQNSIAAASDGADYAAGAKHKGKPAKKGDNSIGGGAQADNELQQGGAHKATPANPNATAPGTAISSDRDKAVDSAKAGVSSKDEGGVKQANAEATAAPSNK